MSEIILQRPRYDVSYYWFCQWKRNVKGSWPFAFMAAGVESENPITEYGYAEMIRIIPSTRIWSVRRIRAPSCSLKLCRIYKARYYSVPVIFSFGFTGSYEPYYSARSPAPRLLRLAHHLLPALMPWNCFPVTAKWKTWSVLTLIVERVNASGMYRDGASTPVRHNVRSPSLISVKSLFSQPSRLIFKETKPMYLVEPSL